MKFKTKLRSHYFSYRIVDGWNNLPEHVVSAPSLNAFERRLDKFWSNQNIKYNFRATLHLHTVNNAPIDSNED